MIKEVKKREGLNYIIACIGLIILLLILQIVTRLDTAISFAYMAVILLTMLIPSRRYTYIFAVTASLFIITGFYFSIPTIDPAKFMSFIYTRSSSLLSIWVTAFLVIKFKKTQEDMKKSQETAQRYLDIAPLFFLVGGPDGKIRLINKTGCEILGYEEKEVVGKNWIDNFVPPEMRDRSYEVFQNAVANGIPFNEGYQNFVLTKDGRRRLIKWKAIVIKDVNGNMESLLTAGEDITDKIELEEITTALEKEKQLNELKTRFVAMASHEFRTPLSTILSSASLVEKYNDSAQIENRSKHIGRIKTTVRNLTNILNDFLSLDKVEAGFIEANPAMFNLDRFCGEVVEELQTVVKPGQQINYLYTADKREVFTDKNIVRIILTNLLNNAIKYSPEKSHINITIASADNEISISVKDNGIGIPEADKPHLFDRFFRAGNAVNISGTGLGLYIVKRYAEFIGGTISFSSEVNKGTTFVVNIPVGNSSV
ncbi:MAG TPA: PAS domain-containing sensor histidine kinase [Bacteroidia bacterium]|jgi:PAS domain S-box-containing protein|nr:PAS domain-containing sensor histidine kinase [Bacteroidia bacterium]